jgi:predicted PurR-regulated permease PerM
MPGPDSTSSSRTVNPTLVQVAAYSWRILVVAAVVVGAVWLLGQLWVVVMALAIATLLSRALDPVATWLRARGWRPGLAATVSLVGFIVALVALFSALVPLVVDQVEELGPTLSTAVDDVEDWLVDDSPFDVSRQDLDDLREQASDAFGRAARTSSESIASGALAALEGVLGIFLALVTTFFILKDGARFQRFVLGRLPDDREVLARRLAARYWTTLGGYLKGAAILGLVEGVIIGLTLALVGAQLAIPVAIITFVAAFVPIVGAIVAGAIATLVALATAGFVPAVIVVSVAIVVQQLDNDVLAPVIYGKALQLHPLVILFAVVAGGALFGIGGTLLAVPVTAVVLNALDEAERVRLEAAEDQNSS